MTSLPDRPERLALAVEILTAWRTRDQLGPDTFGEILTAACVDAKNPVLLVAAMADLADALLQGCSASAGRILSTPDVLVGALTACEDGTPWGADRVGMDCDSILDRVGRTVASLPR